MRILAVAIALLVIATTVHVRSESLASDTTNALQLKGHQDEPAAAEASEPFLYTEDFTTTTYLDAANTTANWDTTLGELGLYPYTPSLTGGCAIPGEPLDIFIDGNTAFVATGTAGLQVVDITVVEHPQVVAQYTSPSAGSGQVVAVAVSGDFAFVADSQLGLEVLDILDTRNPVRIGGHDTGVGARDVVVDDDLVVLAGPQGGLVLINVGIRATPFLLSKCITPGVAQAVTLAGRIAYVADGQAGVQVVDISDRARPAIIGSIDTPGTALDIAVAGNRAYVADGDNFLVLDITEPASPVLVGDLAVTALSVHVLGNRAFVAGLTAGLQVIDITDPANPSLDFGYNVGLSATVDVTVDGKLAFATDRGAGLQVIEVSQLCAPTIVGTVGTPGIATNVAVSGDVAYVTNGSAGFSVVNISDLRSPTLLTNYATSRSLSGIAVSGDILCVGASEGGFWIFDISDPSNPIRVGINIRSYATTVRMAGNRAYVADANEGLKIFDISDPARPMMVGRAYHSGVTIGLAVAGNLALVSTSSPNAVYVHDISQPPSTRLLGLHYATGLTGVEIVGDLAFVAGATGFRVLDISDPTSPTLVGTSNAPSSTHGLATTGNLALLARAGSVRVIDVSDPTNPTLVGPAYTGGGSQGLAVDGDMAFVASQWSGLSVVRFLQGEVAQLEAVSQSTTIVTAAEPIVAVRLASVAVGNVAWEISANGGSDWQAIESDERWNKLTSPGTDLRWRNSLEWAADNPRVSKVEIDYRVGGADKRVIRVDADATGANDGSNWADAFPDLQDALEVAAPGDEVWVVEGAYRPTAGTDRMASFHVVSGVGLYGGFAGHESERDQRDWTANSTELVGEIGLPGLADNSYHVLVGANLDSTTVLSGFTISGGNAASPWGADFDGNYSGGGFSGINCSARFHQLVFADNSAEYGGGVSLMGGRPSFSEVQFLRNSAGHAAYGGGLLLWDCESTVVNAAFIENTSNWGGGGLVVTGGKAFVSNAVFYRNVAGDDWGGGIVDLSYGLTVVNSTFAYNRATSRGGGIYTARRESQITNCVFVGNYNFRYNLDSPSHISGPNVTIAHSILPGSGSSGESWDPSLGMDGGGNLDADPLLVDALNGDLHLTMASPAVNAGDSSALPEGLVLDLDGNLRIYGASVDMGAYEFQAPSSAEIFVAKFTPQTLNLRGNGNSAKVHLSKAWTFPLEDIDTGSLVLNDSIPPQSVKVKPGQLKADFDRKQVAASLDIGMQVSVVLSGLLSDGTPFSAADTISVIDPGQARLASTAPVHAVGSASSVHWPVLADEASAFDGYLSLDGGVTWAQLFAGLEGTTSYTWVLEADETPSAQVLVEGHGASGVVHAITGLFTISNAGVVTAVPPVPLRAYLSAAPNPFNPSTTISYGLPIAGRVQLTIFDLAGRRVKVLVSEHVSAGEHEAQWHGRDAAGKQVASGVYLYRLRAGDFVKTKRMVLVK